MIAPASYPQLGLLKKLKNQTRPHHKPFLLPVNEMFLATIPGTHHSFITVDCHENTLLFCDFPGNPSEKVGIGFVKKQQKGQA